MVVLAEALEEKGWRVIFEIVAPVPEYVGRGIFARHEFDNEPAPQPGKETCDAQQGNPLGEVQMMDEYQAENKVCRRTVEQAKRGVQREAQSPAGRGQLHHQRATP